MNSKLIKVLILLVFANSLVSGQIRDIKSIQGVWLSEGYGRVIDVKNNKVIIYDICEVNCNKSQIIPEEMLFNLFEIKKEHDTILVVSGGITKLYFNKIAQLPNLCELDRRDKKDPVYNFETLWHTFNENYCYFKERKINWKALKDKYQSQINSETKPFDLFLVMKTMIQELNDGHSDVYVPDNLEKDFQKYQKTKRKLRRKKLLDSLGEDYKLPAIHVDKLHHDVLSNYVKDVKTYNYGTLNYGLINNDIAIVQINGMDQFANYNIPEGVSESKAERLYTRSADASDNYTKDNADGASYIMDKVIYEIKNTKTCIIDIRFNGGGYDEVQLEILKRFATQDTLVVTKKARAGDGFTKKSKTYLSPTSNTYKGDVYILTSYQTASAAEDFTLGTMSAIPNAIRIGSNTTGIFSDILDKKLPNGWKYGLSNEIYESPQGTSYEVTGIPPHHVVNYDKRGYWFYKQFYDNKTGKDEAIELVFKLVEN